MRRSLFLLAAGAAALIAEAAQASETLSYSYDARGRLKQVAHSGSVNSGKSTAYTHDKADNRLTKTTTP